LDTSILAGTAGIVVLIIAGAFAVTVIAMPFFVWGMRDRIARIDSRMDDLCDEVTHLAMTLDSIDLRLDDALGEIKTQETLGALLRLNELRAQRFSKGARRATPPRAAP
jgi:hypothetical protein